MGDRNTLQVAIDELVPGGGKVLDASPVGGGCISQASRVVVDVGSAGTRTLFVKSNGADFAENFRCESEGLRRLAGAEAIRVPEPIAVGEAAGRAWLAIEWVETGRVGGEFFRTFGERLAGLHRSTRGTTIGLDHDNFLGAARQPNGSADSWVEFVAEQRLGFQLRWGVDRGGIDAGLRRSLEELISRLPVILEGRDDETSLLHGDLWSGNYLAADDAQPAIIDPAIYHGCREAEFGMLRLFGGCPEPFYEAYRAAWPMPDGWQRRTNVYVLYHLLNHLNLFGGGYAGSCREKAAEILRG